MDDAKISRAKTVYAQLCSVLDDRNWKYSKNDQRLMIDLTVHGEDIPMQFVMFVDADRQLFRVLSPMPFKFEADKLIDGAVAACVATYGLADGSFDYDIKNGCIFFKQTYSFIDGEMSSEVLDYMINWACSCVDAYNDKFEALSKGDISVSDFVYKF